MSSSSNGLLILALFLIGNIFSKTNPSKEIENQVFPTTDDTYYFGHLYTLPESSSGEGRFGLMVECLNPKEMHPHGAALIRRDSLNINQIRHLVGKRVGFKIDGDDIVTHIVDLESVGEIDTFTNWPISLNGHDEELEGKHRTGEIQTFSSLSESGTGNTTSRHYLLSDDENVQYPVMKITIDGDDYWAPSMLPNDSIYYLMTNYNVVPYRTATISSAANQNVEALPLIYSISNFHWHDMSLIDDQYLDEIHIRNY